MNSIFFSSKIWRKNQKKTSATNEKQRTHHIPLPNQRRNAKNGIIAQRGAPERHLQLKKFGFYLFSRKTRQRKIFGSWKIQPQSITTLPIQLSNKQTDPANVFVENECQNQETQWAMRNVESVWKNSAFSTKTDRKKIWWETSLQASQQKVVSSISAKILALPSLLYRRDAKIYPLPSKKIWKLKFFSLTHRKIFSAAKSLEYDRSWTRRSVHTKIG